MPRKKKPGRKKTPLDPLAALLERMARQAKSPRVRRCLRQLARKGTFTDWTYYGEDTPRST